ncbi:MAG: nickel-dependent lactate racemase [Promethearchaeota archaeon]
MEIKIPWDDKFIELEIPNKWNISICDLKEQKQILDSDEKIDKRLDKVCQNPINSKSLELLIKEAKSKQKPIVIIADDRTRPTPISKVLNFIDIQLEKADFDKSNVNILIANGIHRLMTEKEIEMRIGRKIFQNYVCLNHDFKDKNSLEYLGTSISNIPVIVNKNIINASLIISISTIESHGQAGFGGGLKNIIPGTAGIETINYTHDNRHLQIENSNFRSLSGIKKDKNKMRQLLEEAALFAIKKTPSFIINSILDPIQPIDFVAGDPVKAHEYGTDIVEKLFGFKIEREGDIVISNSTPLDADFRAGTKSMSMSMNFCKKNGVIVNIIRAREGYGDLKIPNVSKFKGLLIKTLPLSILRKGIEKYGGPPDQSGGTLDIIKIAKYFNPYLYIPSIGKIDQFKNMGFNFFENLQELIDSIDKQFQKTKSNKSPKCYVLPFGGVTFRKLF